MLDSIFSLNVLFQFLTGIAALFAFLMQVLWHDKRTLKFKRARNISVALAILLLLAGIAATINDNIEKSAANLAIRENFDSVTSNFDSVKTKLQRNMKQNDSLMIVVSFLKTEVSENKDEIKRLTAVTRKGLNENRESVERIGKISSQNYLTADDIGVLVEALKGNPGKVCFDLVNDDPECLKYIKSLREVFKKASWQTNNKFNSVGYGGPIEGLRVCVNEGKYPKGLPNLVEAFKKVGIKYSPVYNGTGRLDDWIYIEVGSLR